MLRPPPTSSRTDTLFPYPPLFRSQVILVLRFGLPEIAGRFDLRRRLARPQAGGVDVGDGVAGHALLPGRGEEDRRTVRGAKVVALAVPRRRVVDLEEELQIGRAHV